MRIAIPSRFNVKPMAIFIAALFVGQVLEGTDFLFAVLTAVYVALWAVAFNVAGGLDYPSGAFIFANGLLSVVLGFGAKVLLFEPGQRNMQAPMTTMLVYCAGMVMLVVIAFLSRLLRPAKPLLSGFKNLEDIRRASIICLFASFILNVLLGAFGAGEGTVLSALRQVNGFPVMSILLATTYEVLHSGGKRSVNWVVATGVGFHLFYGLFYFGKESMLMGFLAWSVAASLQGYSFSRTQVFWFAMGTAFMVYYMVPYSQYVREYASSSGSIRENIPTALEYLSDLPRTRRLYYEALANVDNADEAHLYDGREGFLDRLIIVAPDDQLIAFTDQGHVFGLAPTFSYFANIVPRFIWKGKQTTNVGNTFAHEMGYLSEEDTTTGISFSPTAEAYHQAKWVGVLIVMPICVFLCFIAFDSVAGSSKQSVFALLPIIQLFEAGSGGGLVSPIHLASFGMFGLFLISWTTKTAGPLVLSTLRRGSGTKPSSPATALRPTTRPIERQRTIT